MKEKRERQRKKEIKREGQTWRNIRKGRDGSKKEERKSILADIMDCNIENLQFIEL